MTALEKRRQAPAAVSGSILDRPKPAKLLYYADAAKIRDYNPALLGNGCYRIIPNRPANSATLTQSEKKS